MPKKLTHVAPPNSSDIEMRALSTLIHIGDPDNLRIQNAMLQLDRECFHNINHRVLFDLIDELFTKGNKFDLIEFIGLVPTEQYHLVNKTIRDEYISVNNLEHDVSKLKAYRLLRKQLKTLVNTVNLSLEETLPEESLDVIRDQLQLLSATNTSTQSSIVRTYEMISEEILNNEDDNSQFTVDIPGLPPVPNRALITIAGRSGHGKTFFAMFLMDKIIDQHPDKQALYFNLEMHERVMLERHAKLLGVHGSSRTEIIRNGISKLIPKNVSLVSEPMITIDQIETESRLAAFKQPLSCIVVDYLGLIRSKTKAERKDLEQSDIAKRLAALSLELNCVVIALIQVNRDIKNRPVGDRCPVPTDSAESMGSVHSSSWWLGIDQPQNDDDSGEFENLFLVQCRKNRGESGLFKLQFKFMNGMFHKWERPFCSKYSQKLKNEPAGF